jgi:hypothetical protein
LATTQNDKRLAWSLWMMRPFETGLHQLLLLGFDLLLGLYASTSIILERGEIEIKDRKVKLKIHV